VATLILYPAIDLKDGQCVRVVHGDLATATVFNDSPADQARAWVKAGFHWIHVVDLNGAVAGQAVNAGAVEAILGAVSVPVQLGGGIRTLKDVERWIEAGVSRVILGTVAVKDPDVVIAAALAYPEQIAVSVDVRKGRVAVNGWTADTELDAVTVARRFEDAGVGALIVAVSIPVIAAGGLASVDDIARLKARVGAPVAGAVLGRALYNGAIDPAEALRLAA
jgi:phosphoribosylformimino-5-aminoimidazole carboxamide ribotide isomerase